MASVKLSDYIKVRVVDNKAIVLVAQAPHGIKFFGSSMRAGAQPTNSYGTDRLSQLTIYPESGQDGILAIVGMHHSTVGKAVVWDEFATFLKVGWKEKDGTTYPFLDLDEPWIPIDRVGQVTSEILQVLLSSGERFCYTDPLNWGNDRDTLPRLVRDGNLLARYLVGKASEDEVRTAADSHQEAADAPKRVKELERVLVEHQRMSKVQLDTLQLQQIQLDVLTLEHGMKVEELDVLKAELETVKLDVETEELLRKGAEQTLSALIEDMKLEWLYKLLKRLPERFHPVSLDWIFWVYDVLAPQATLRKARSEESK